MASVPEPGVSRRGAGSRHCVPLVGQRHGPHNLLRPLLRPASNRQLWALVGCMNTPWSLMYLADRMSMAPGMAGCGEKGTRLTSAQQPARQGLCLETGPRQPGRGWAPSLAGAPAAAPPPDAKPSNPPWVGAQVSVSMPHLELQVCRAWQQVGGG